MRKKKPGEIKKTSQQNKATKWQNWDLNLGSQNPETVFLINYSASHCITSIGNFIKKRKLEHFTVMNIII